MRSGRLALLPVLLLLLACGDADTPAEQPEATTSSADPLQVVAQVTGEFTVDGTTTQADDLESALSGARPTMPGSPVVELRCEPGVTMASVAELHAAMRAQDLRRIQYDRDTAEPIPYLLPDAALEARLDSLDRADRCTITVAVNGAPRLEDEGFDPYAVAQRLDANPRTVFVLEVPGNARYADFVRVLGDLTRAGGKRVMIRIEEG